MNVTNVSKSSNVILSPLNNNNVIKVLEKQKVQLQDLIQKTRESKMDDKQKQDKIKELQDQIQQIDMEIQQKRVEKLNQNSDKEQGTTDSQTSTNMINDDSSQNSLSGITGLIQAASSYSNTKVLKKMKREMQNNIQITKTEIKLDGFTTAYKEKNLQSMESKIKSLDDKFGDTVQAAQEHIKKSAKQESNEQSKPKNNEDNTKIESTLSASNSQESKTENIVLVANSEKESYKNRELAGKQIIYTKVDIKL